MPLTSDDFTTDTDRWGYLTGARFVGPDEWEQHAQNVIGRRNIHMWPIADGLALAADDDGLLLDFRHDEFYEGPMSDGMRTEDDDPSWKLTYDRFDAVVLTKLMFNLLKEGLLATRGNGDSVDYRLTLPGKEGQA